MYGGAIAFTFLIACGAYSQTLNIWPAVAPGSENWIQKERIVENTRVGTVVFNVPRLITAPKANYPNSPAFLRRSPPP